MNLQTFIMKGQAIFTSDGLRCNQPREDDPAGRTCHKLLVKFNSIRQIAGNFRCDRCGQEIEVKVSLAKAGSEQARRAPKSESPRETQILSAMDERVSQN